MYFYDCSFKTDDDKLHEPYLTNGIKNMYNNILFLILCLTKSWICCEYEHSRRAWCDEWMSHMTSDGTYTLTKLRNVLETPGTKPFCSTKQS